MEHDDRHLDFLSNSMIQYFNEVLIHKNCVSSTFRKYSVKHDKDVEFILLLLRSTSENTKSFYQIDSSCLTEEASWIFQGHSRVMKRLGKSFELILQEAKNLIKISESWCLHLADVSLEGNKLFLRLNRPHTFCTICSSILNRKSDYGKCFSEKQTVRITSEDTEISDLTLYRLKLLKNVAQNLLKVGGYQIRAGEEDRWVHFTTKSFSQAASEMKAKLKILCAPVVNSVTKMKEIQITPEEYCKLRLRDMEAKSGNKISNEQILKSLVDASITVSLLQVKSNQAVSLNLSPDCIGARDTGSKGGVFLQYNASRLAAIRRKYNEGVQEGIYSKIPNPEEVDFGLLKEPEEWALLFNFLLEYPSMIHRISKDLMSGKSNIHQICDFLSKMCSLFSVYYRKIRILLEPRDHLLKTIHARLILALSVEHVLENGLAILNIKKIENM